MSRTEYGARVTEIIDAATGGFEYPESFEADVDACFARRMTPEQAAEKLLAEYRRLTRPVVTYGCVICQSHHTEGDELFALHLHRQAKHHYSEAPATPADVLRRVREDAR